MQKINAAAKQQELLIAVLVALLGGALLLTSLCVGYKTSGELGFTTEEHYQLGVSLYETGKLSLYEQPSLLRPPGYPSLVAFALHVKDFGPVAHLDTQVWILFVHLLLLVLGALVFFKTLRFWIPTLPALLLMAAYIMNPFSHYIVRAFSYPILDVFFITCSLFLCSLYVQRDITLKNLAFGGLIFALGSLTRPVFLTSPILILAILYWVKGLSGRSAIKQSFVFGLFFILFLTPYIWRNYSITNRFVPITNQGPWAFWGNSVTPLPKSNAFSEPWLPWGGLVWAPYGAEQFRVATGEDYSDPVLYAHSEELSKHFGNEFVRDLRNSPQIYLNNIATNIVFYLFAPRLFEETVFWRAFIPSQAQSSSAHIAPNQIWSSFNSIITILITPMIFFYLWRGSSAAKLAIVLIGYFTLNYSIVFLDSRYIYSLLPAIWLSFALMLATLVEENKSAKTHSRDLFFYASFVFLIFQAVPVVQTLLLL